MEQRRRVQNDAPALPARSASTRVGIGPVGAGRYSKIPAASRASRVPASPPSPAQVEAPAKPHASALAGILRASEVISAPRLFASPAIARFRPARRPQCASGCDRETARTCSTLQTQTPTMSHTTLEITLGQMAPPKSGCVQECHLIQAAF